MNYNSLGCSFNCVHNIVPDPVEKQNKVTNAFTDNSNQCEHTVDKPLIPMKGIIRIMTGTTTIIAIKLN